MGDLGLGLSLAKRWVAICVLGAALLGGAAWLFLARRPALRTDPAVPPRLSATLAAAPPPREDAGEAPDDSSEEVSTCAVSGLAFRAEQPAAGARVELRFEDGGSRWAEVNPEGAFAFDQVPGGWVLVQLSLGADEDFQVVDLSPPGECPEGLRLDASGWAELAGRVLDVAGEPVAGAEVSLEHGGELDDEDSPPLLGRSNVRGEYRIRVHAPGPYRLDAAADGFATLIAQSVKLRWRAVERLDVTLQPEALIEGVVVDPQGQPVPGVDIGVAAGVPSEAVVPPAQGVKTGAQGEFTVGSLANGAYVLNSYSERFGPATLSVHAPDPSVRWVLEPGVDIGGDVVDESGVGEEGISVSLQELFADGGGVEAQTTQTYYRGRFVFSHVADGDYRLSASGDRAGDDEPAEGQGVQVRVVHPQGASVHLRVARGLTLSGRVTDEEGRPVLAAEVIARPERASAMDAAADEGRARRQDADAEGAFKLEHLSEGSYLVSGQSPDGLWFQPEPVRARAGGSPVHLVLRAAPRIVGRVVDSDGRPVTAFHVDLEARAENESRSSGQEVDDPDGRFFEPARPPGTVELSVSEEGYAGVTRSVKCDGVHDVHLADIVLANARKVVVLATDRHTSEPVGGALFLAEGGTLLGDSERSVSTTSDGRAVLHLPRAEATVRVSHPRYLETSVRISADQKTLAVQLDPGGTIAGTVRDPAGAPATGTLVVARDGEVLRGAVVGPDGSFELSGFKGGRQTLLVLNEGDASEFSALQLGPPVPGWLEGLTPLASRQLDAPAAGAVQVDLRVELPNPRNE